VIVQYPFRPFGKQVEVLEDGSRELLIGGGLGGSKSTTLVHKLFRHCIRYPGVLDGLFRKKGTHLKTSTLITWQKEIPRELYEINNQSSLITVHTGRKHNSQIFFGGLDSTEDTDKFSSTDFGMVGIDQAEEITEQNYVSLAQRLRCKLPDGSYPHFQILTSCNPRNCYLRDRFILNKAPNRNFIQMLAKDNPYLAPGYLDEIKALYANRPEILRALIDGSWDILAEDDVIIQLSDAQACTRINDPLLFTDKRIVSCDPARFGKCETPIYGWVGTKVVKQDIYGQKDEDYTASKCLAMANEIEANTIAIDEGGPGAGVVTILRKLVKGTQMQIMALNSASTLGVDKRYYNLRAEMSFEAAELIKNHKVSLPDDPILVGQLAKSTYSYNIGKLIVDEKADIKPSPDRADAIIIGLYALRRALPMAQTIKAAEFANTETQINTYQYGKVRKEDIGSYADAER
jgi:hypothetical protein